MGKAALSSDVMDDAGPSPGSPRVSLRDARPGTTDDIQPAVTIFGSPLNEERLSIIFYDPLWEESYLKFIAHEHSSHQVRGFLISAGLAVAFAWRGTFSTWQSKVLLSYVMLCVCGNLAWVALHHWRPHQAAAWRNPVAHILSIAIHSAIICLPPLTYGSFKNPESLPFAFLLIIPNSRFLQSLFTMGVWTASGFLADLGLLIAILFATLHWNKDECTLLCEAQPGLAKHYGTIGGMLRPWLGAQHLAVDAVGVCLQLRYFLQGTCGFILPIAIGYWREMKDRRAFAARHNVELRKHAWHSILLEAGLSYSVALLSIGVMAQMFMTMPQLARLPVVLRKGYIPEAEGCTPSYPFVPDIMPQPGC